MNPFQLKRIVDTLGEHSYRYATEAQLHDAIKLVLSAVGVTFEHELVAGEDRFDFYAEGVVIEVKIGGSFAEAVRQVDRYCKRDDVVAVVIATTKSWGLTKSHHILSKKPIYFVKIRGQSF